MGIQAHNLKIKHKVKIKMAAMKYMNMNVHKWDKDYKYLHVLENRVYIST